MTENIDWAAPVEPGRAMLGLSLGLTLNTVRRLLGENGSIVTLPNAPKLVVDYSEDGVVFLRAAEISDCQYDWQNVVARLVFNENELSGIIVLGDRGNEEFAYKGKLFDEIGLGSEMSDLLEFGKIEYDDVEEVFYCDEWKGIEIGGAGACDLSVNPSQPITSLKVFRSI